MRQEITPRMLEMIRFRAEGLTQKEISKITGLGLQTVKDHCKNTLERLSAKSMEHAIAIAFRKGWMDEVKHEEATQEVQAQGRITDAHLHRNDGRPVLVD